MIDERFNYLAVVISLIGTYSYLVKTVKGEVKPNKVSWFLWGFAPLIAFFAQIKQGIGLESLRVFMAGFGPLVIFFASFVNKKSYWKLTKLDIVCGILSVLGLLLWSLTRIGNLAILFALIADGLASIPTIVKSYYFPETENYLAYLFSFISALIAVLTISDWTFTSFGFLSYLLVVNFICTIFIKFKLGKKFSSL